MKRFASENPDFPILQVPLAELENEGNWVKKEIKISLKICWFRKNLRTFVPARIRQASQRCSNVRVVLFLYISLSEILVFSNDSYFFVNIENMEENSNVLIIKEL